MANRELDIVFVADARFPGGTSTALANEVRAARKGGFNVGLIQVEGHLLRRSRAFHPAIRQLVDSGALALLDPSERQQCRLALIHHPTLFSQPTERPLGISAEHCVLVAHHPAYDAASVAQYDIKAQLASIAESAGLSATVAPVGPNVRASLSDSGAPMLAKDWSNLIDADAWRRPFRRFGSPIVLGRHSRPDPLKWPENRETILAAWPADPRFSVEILGGGPAIDEFVGSVPENWRVHAFGERDPRSFLHGLDAYAYFHSSRWIEAFGYCVLEALAVGLPTILPPSFRPLFGEGAIYGRPEDVAPVLLELSGDTAAQKRQRSAALSVVRENYDLSHFSSRVDELFGMARRREFVPVRRPRSPRGERIALMMTSNGVGLGHLTRMMAVAGKLPGDIRPIFFTLSRAARLAVEAGYLVEHSSFHRYIGTTPELWNPMLEKELRLLLDFYAPDVLVFDGNVPYAGLLGALRRNPQVRTLWMRRGFWRDDEGGILPRATRFDMVVEPGDVAGELDNGPTSALRSSTVQIEPVMLVLTEERLSRREARRQLGIAPCRRVVALQLGSGSNFDFSAARSTILDRVLADPGVEIIELLSPIAESRPLSPPLDPRHRQLRLYPAFRFSRAFDAAIVAAGYNSFHENLAGGIPSLFLANMAGEMDRQDLRAQWAATKGMALSGVGLTEELLVRQVERLLDPAWQKMIRDNLAGTITAQGATQAARLIEELAFATRIRAG